MTRCFATAQRGVEGWAEVRGAAPSPRSSWRRWPTGQTFRRCAVTLKRSVATHQRIAQWPCIGKRASGGPIERSFVSYERLDHRRPLSPARMRKTEMRISTGRSLSILQDADLSVMILAILVHEESAAVFPNPLVDLQLTLGSFRKDIPKFQH